MKCEFCGREVAPGTLECPYCHYQFKVDAKVLSPDERDTFDGVTIEEDGRAFDHGAENAEHGRELYQEQAGQEATKIVRKHQKYRCIPLAAAADY